MPTYLSQNRELLHSDVETGYGWKLKLTSKEALQLIRVILTPQNILICLDVKFSFLSNSELKRKESCLRKST